MSAVVLTEWVWAGAWTCIFSCQQWEVHIPSPVPSPGCYLASCCQEPVLRASHTALSLPGQQKVGFTVADTIQKGTRQFDLLSGISPSPPRVCSWYTDQWDGFKVFSNNSSWKKKRNTVFSPVQSVYTNAMTYRLLLQLLGHLDIFNAKFYEWNR